jgi:hypothetical protein
MRPGFALRVTTTMAVSARLALLALLHVLHSLFGVVIRVEGAKQVHIVCGLVAEHLAPFAVSPSRVSRTSSRPRPPRPGLRGSKLGGFA